MRFMLSLGMISVLVPICAAADWSGFRGSRGNGITQQAATPVRWDAESGVRWKVAMPSGGNGSPIVVGDRVFVATAEDAEGHRRSLLCFDAATGDQRWKRAVDFNRTMPTHKTNPYGGSTPASDGRYVVVWHGSAGLFAYTIEGEPLWHRELGEFRHMWGYGTSPVIDGDQVLLHTGPGKRVFLAAFDLQTGKERWRHREPVEGDGERNEAGHYLGSWSTPVLHEWNGKRLAVCAFATRVCGFDAESGELLWYCRGLSGDRGDLAYSSPMLEEALCVMVGGFRGPALAFEISGRGDLTETNRLWRNLNNPQSIGTGILIDGKVYRPGAGPNLIECIDGRTGETLWKERAGDAAFWSSIVFDGTYAYVTDQQGTTVVFQPSPQRLDVVAENGLGERCNATPALADNCVYIRTYDHLWCIDGK